MKRFHTPEEAEKMRCCKPEFIHCKADKCMGWRWKPKETRWIKESELPPEGWTMSNNPPSNIVSLDGSEKDKYIEYERVEEKDTGFCGIAGVPSIYD